MDEQQRIPELVSRLQRLGDALVQENVGALSLTMRNAAVAMEDAAATLVDECMGGIWTPPKGAR